MVSDMAFSDHLLAKGINCVPTTGLAVSVGFVGEPKRDQVDRSSGVVEEGSHESNISDTGLPSLDITSLALHGENDNTLYKWSWLWYCMYVHGKSSRLHP